MPSDSISFKDTGYFSELICDYLDEKQDLTLFYNRFPNLENFKLQIEEKERSFSDQSRTILLDALKSQYENSDISILSKQHLESLKDNNTFTITTGHQLNLFTGPLYFLYKIVSTINLCKQLKHKYPEFNFVPIYWMATEDHDFEEINYFNFKGKKIKWTKTTSGAVGELSTSGLDAVFNLFSKALGTGNNANTLRNLFNDAYLKHTNLAQATRFLVNELFKDYGLIIVDANDAVLKKQFIPIIKDELFNKTSHNQVLETNKRIHALSNNYKIQVNPRDINLFYIKDRLRERIIFKNQRYSVLNTDIFWTEHEILNEVENFPERFSPNVIMRPLYQEVILPNLCYIGGGGELAYWFQLKSYFNKCNVPFPILLLRNSVVIQTKNQKKKLDKLHISKADIFLKRHEFINKKVRAISNINIDFSDQKQHLINQFKSLYELAEQTDKSFIGAVKAQENKQLKGLEKLEKRLLKAQKRKLADHVLRIAELQNELFPNGNLQERNANFSEFYLEYGNQLIPQLIDNLDPLQLEFTLLTL